jgi:putative transposase
VIIVEDLNVENMKIDTYRSLARNISDVSWAEFFRMLDYKSLWRGKYYIEVNPRNTSKKCSVCGKINKNLKLSDREWQCKHCHSKHDRDFNASINILYIGLKKLGQELPEFQNALNENVYSFSIGNPSL